jgi:hypothetical protein
MAPSNLLTLADACDAVLSLDDFWLIAELTDWSYEVGAKNAHFARSIAQYRELGLSVQLIQQLENGINGNLADLLGCEQNKGAGQDVELGGIESSRALAEIKMVHTVTMPKYYPCIAADCVKLAMRRRDFDGDLFLVVFFIHLPNYRYPKGVFNGAGFPSRTFRNRGIQDQFERTRNQIGQEPAWPAKAPRIRSLTEPSSEVLAIVERWCALFECSPPWTFDSKEHLSDAAAGYAIWQIP